MLPNGSHKNNGLQLIAMIEYTRII